MMLNHAFQIVKNMGLRYSFYRLRHELEKITGILKIRHPASAKVKYFISLDEFRKYNHFFVIPDREKITIRKLPNLELQQKARRILNGEFPYFSGKWLKLGSNYSWISNPETGFKYDINKHWSEIPDFSPTLGDIKYVWERSRFTWLLTIIRSDYHHNEDHSEFVFDLIEDWIENNPINCGPNWRCSQEISLRIFNWCFALNFYKNSSALTEERWRKIQNVIYWSLHHVYHHIDFSRIAVRNNHAITETLFLALSNILFNFIPITQKWSLKGRKWFEKEIDYQIYEDGTYLQHSMNYHRTVIQLLTLGLSLTEINGKPFSDLVYVKAYKSLNFLYQCMQEDNGFLPNYGANDGAWFFPFSDTNYRDFRPQLNALHQLLTGKSLSENETIREETLWFGIDKFQLNKKFPSLQKLNGAVTFPVGGYYLIREPETFTFLKCGTFKDRPSQADVLHIDIWYKNTNILFDPGTYKYNTEKKYINFFNGTNGHNTLTVNDESQMLKGDRFIWFYWTKALDAKIDENQENFIFEGSISGFNHISKDIIHKRKVVKYKNKPIWIVEDWVSGKNIKYIKTHWNVKEEMSNFIFFNTFDIKGESLKPQKVIGWYSELYGIKQEFEQLIFKSENNYLKTVIEVRE